MLPTGLQLWHCGAVANAGDLDDDQALWTTRDPDRQYLYAESARATCKYLKKPPHLSALVTRQPLYAADFASSSLGEFTATICRTQHERMKQFLRQWMLENDFDVIVRLSGDPSEVVLAMPGVQASVTSSVPL